MAEAGSPQEQKLREAVDDFNAKVAQYLVDPDLALHPFWSEDVVFVNFEPSPFPGTYHGHDGIRGWAKDLFEPLTNAWIDVVEVRQDDPYLAVRLKLTGEGRSSGIQATLEWGSLLTIRDGTCIRAASDVSFERTLERLREERARAKPADPK